MANKAKIVYRVNSIPTVGSDNFEVGVSGSGVTKITEIPVNTRATYGQFSTLLQSAVGITNRLVEALYADYTIGGGGAIYPIAMTVVVSGAFNDITLEATSYDFNFNPTTYTPSWLTVISNVAAVPPAPEFEITNVTVQQASTADRNTHVRFDASISNGVAPFTINTPVIKSAPLSSDLNFDYLRQPSLPLINLSITDDALVTDIFSMPTVDFWTLDSVTVNNSFGGATIVVNTTTILGNIPANKEYSLDQEAWYVSPNFTGILEGSYTMYVRDNYGALRSTTFEVVNITADKPTAFFDMSQANPLRHVPVTNFNDCSVIANWDNALFSELYEQGKWPNVEWQPYNQLISECDLLVNQIKTNYDNIVITATNCEGETLDITPTLKVQNILLEDMRDCTFRPISNPGQESDGKTLLYFTGGYIYDPETEISTGEEYYNPTKGLFPFAKYGTLFTISGTTLLNGTYTQLGTLKDQTTGYWGIILDLPFTGTDPTTGTVKTNYNKLDYNIWEYTLVGSALSLNTIYKIDIAATDDDPNYPDVFWHSEPVQKVTTENTVILDYSNEENTSGLDFTTGAVFRLRLEARYIDGIINEETDDFKTDYGKKVILRTIISDSFNFEGMLYPFYLVKKIAYASGMSNLLINNVKFVKGEELEVESLIKNNNPFQIVNRSYQKDSETLTTYSGLVTQTQQVIGSSTVVAIGDNN